MEQSFLAYLRGRCRSLPQVSVGIGDDAAVIEPPTGQLIACTDQIIDGTDFRSQQLAPDHSLADVGYKSMAINLSDIAAMGAVPTSALVTLSLPKTNATRIAGEVYEGILQAAEEFQVAIAGGDISTYEGPLAITVTLLGHVPPNAAWLRRSAELGDAVLVTGAVGGSILGRHLRPNPRVELAQILRDSVNVHGAIDISDGLSLDLDRLCAASGVGIELNIATIPIHDDAIVLSEKTGRTPFEHAWSDGEDFELILTMNQADADKVLEMPLPCEITQIGKMISRTGLWKHEGTKLVRLSPQGYIH
ncbi:Thiamine-monophosphate kinase [Planctomycetes bacterium CA13]|uniref:Thiamine-monophosphate kinase n=1 Tax=Novipirellula herctigrandis TaxID=2527986 RepID=A0A5C5YVM1_9BACT|nr:Thiamine-monophosphate kinase [Planctomycetes bacterium CA13]